MRASIEALLNQINSGKMESDAARILNHIKNYPFSTCSEMERKLNMLHQTLSARLTDLLDLGIIEERGNRKTSRSKETYFKFQPDPAKQKRNAAQRKAEKFQKWIKKGLGQFGEIINPEVKQSLINSIEQ